MPVRKAAFLHILLLKKKFLEKHIFSGIFFFTRTRFQRMAEAIQPKAEENEYLQDVHINENLASSRYVHLEQIQFKRGDKIVKWDMALRPDSVACVIYHRDKKSLMFVKQFRPAIFVSLVRKMPENRGKESNAIDWSKYPISIGETIELCAGLIDKPNLSEVAHMREEIIEECGYDVPESSIRLLKRFVTGIGVSGSHQFLYYAEVDDSMKVSEGGGTDSERIQKVFMTLPEAERYSMATEVLSAPGLLYGLEWFFHHSKYSSH
ncbi:unnamed protein product [Anisakis simplex]|uniref:Uridine diphosphate glucose pyrophosphatase NUDT14 n=1 Tax=Anisakis simplex TaxID=6269 RepID=A0A0M3KCD1_ANISI|nr:unnamed protein product [Anisakis simplex]